MPHAGLFNLYISTIDTPISTFRFFIFMWMKYLEIQLVYIVFKYFVFFHIVSFIIFNNISSHPDDLLIFEC